MPARPGGTHYTFKESPYGSHGLLERMFPTEGQGRRVLDVGCGGAYVSAALTARGYQVVGIDREAQHIDGVRVIEADLDDPLAVRGCFDYVLCADVLEHLKDPLKALRELAMLLGDEGRLVASLPNSGNIYFRLNVLAGRFPSHDKGLFDRTHLHFYTWAGWRELFAAAGLRMERAEVTGMPVGLAFPRISSSLPMRAAEVLAFQCARVWRTMFAYQFIVVARREAAV